MSDKSNGGGEDIFQEFQAKMDERISIRDKQHLDPTERAQFVHELLFWALDLEADESVMTGHVLWDIVCYAVHLLTQYSIALQDQDFAVMARALNTWLFTNHYNMDETATQLGPRRDTHIKFWERQLYEPKEAEPEEMS